MKDTVKKLKRQDMDWDKVFANHLSDEGLISRIYKDLSKFDRFKQLLYQRSYTEYK